MKRFIVAALCVLCSGIPAGSPAEAASPTPGQIARKYNVDFKKIQPLVLNVGTLAPAETPWFRFPLDHAIRRMKLETEGFFNIKVYAGGNMGDDSDVLRKMKEGALQGCGCSAQGVQEAAPEASVFFLPFLFRNYGEVDAVLERFRKEIDAMYLRRGYRLYNLIDTGFMYLYIRNKVSSLEDLKNLTVASWFGGIQDATIEELGAKIVDIPVPETLAAFQKGTVDANISPPVWELSTQTFIYAKYYLDIPFFYSPSVVIYDDAQLTALERRYPAGFLRDILAYFAGIMAEEEGQWRAEIRDYERRCTFAFVNSGRPPVTLSAADQDALYAIGRRVKETLAGKGISPEFLRRVEAELASYRKTRQGIAVD